MFLWEILHRQEPYAHTDTFHIAQGVVAGTLRLQLDAERMPPRARDDSVYAQLMQELWRARPRDRPDFEEIHRRLSAYLPRVLDTDVADTNRVANAAAAAAAESGTPVGALESAPSTPGARVATTAAWVADDGEFDITHHEQPGVNVDSFAVNSDNYIYPETD